MMSNRVEVGAQVEIDDMSLALDDGFRNTL